MPGDNEIIVNTGQLDKAISDVTLGGGNLPHDRQYYIDDFQKGGQQFINDVKSAKVNQKYSTVKGVGIDAYIKKPEPAQQPKQTGFPVGNQVKFTGTPIPVSSTRSPMNPMGQMSFKAPTDVQDVATGAQTDYATLMKAKHDADVKMANDALVHQTGLYKSVPGQGPMPLYDNTEQRLREKAYTTLTTNFLTPNEQEALPLVQQYYAAKEAGTNTKDIEAQIKTKIPDWVPIEPETYKQGNSKMLDQYYDYIVKKEQSDNTNPIVAGAQDFNKLLGMGDGSAQSKFRDSWASYGVYAKTFMLGEKPKDVSVLRSLGESFLKGIAIGGTYTTGEDKNAMINNLYDVYGIKAPDKDKAPEPGFGNMLADAVGGAGAMALMMETTGKAIPIGAAKFGILGEGGLVESMIKSDNVLKQVTGGILKDSFTNHLPFSVVGGGSIPAGIMTSAGMDATSKLLENGLGITIKNNLGYVITKSMLSGLGGVIGQDVIDATTKLVQADGSFQKAFGDIKVSDFAKQQLAMLMTLSMFKGMTLKYDKGQFNGLVDELQKTGNDNLANQVQSEVDNLDKAQQNQPEKQKAVQDVKNAPESKQTPVTPQHLDHSVVDNTNQEKISRPNREIKDIRNIKGGEYSMDKAQSHDFKDPADVQKIQDGAEKRGLKTITIPTSEGSTRVIVYDANHEAMAKRMVELSKKEFDGSITTDESHELASLEGQDPKQFLNKQANKATEAGHTELADDYKSKAEALKTATDGNAAYNHIAQLNKAANDAKGDTKTEIANQTEIEARKYGFEIKRDGDKVQVKDNKGREVGDKPRYNSSNISDLHSIVEEKPTPDNIQKAQDIADKEGLTVSIQDDKMFIKDRDGKTIMSPSSGFKTLNDADYTANKNKLTSASELIANGKMNGSLLQGGIKVEGMTQDEVRQAANDISTGKSTEGGQKLLDALNEMATNDKFTTEKYGDMDYRTLKNMAESPGNTPTINSVKPTSSKGSSIKDLKTNTIGNGEIKSRKPVEVKQEPVQKKSEVIDYTKGKTVEPEEGMTEADHNRLVSEKSDNPAEIIHAYESEREKQSEKNESDVKGNAIKDAIGKKGVSKASYEEHGDKNKITMGLAKEFLRKDGKPIDQIAQEASYALHPEGTGTEITPQDVVEHIEGSSYQAKRSPIMKDLENRFQEVTGKPLTDKVIDEFKESIDKKLQEHGITEQQLSTEDFWKQSPEEMAKQLGAPKEETGLTEPTGQAEGGAGVSQEELKTDLHTAGLIPPEISKELDDAGKKAINTLVSSVKSGGKVLGDFMNETQKLTDAFTKNKVDFNTYRKTLWKYGKALAKNTLIKDYFYKYVSGKEPLTNSGVLGEFQSANDIRQVLNDAYKEAGSGNFYNHIEKNIAHYSALASAATDPALKTSYARTAQGLSVMESMMDTPDDIRNVLKLAFEQPKVKVNGADLQPRSLAEWHTLNEMAKPQKPPTAEQYKFVKSFMAPHETNFENTSLGKIIGGKKGIVPSLRFGLSRFTPAFNAHIWARPEMKETVKNTVSETAHALTGALQEKLGNMNTKLGDEAIGRQWTKQEQDNVAKVLQQEHFVDRKYKTPEELEKDLTPKERGLYEHYKSGRDEMKQTFINAKKKALGYESMSPENKKAFDDKMTKVFGDNGYNPFFRSGDFYVVWHGMNDITGENEHQHAQFETRAEAEAFKKQVTEKGGVGVDNYGERDENAYPIIRGKKEFTNKHLLNMSKGDMSLFNNFFGSAGLNENNNGKLTADEAQEQRDKLGQDLVSGFINREQYEQRRGKTFDNTKEGEPTSDEAKKLKNQFQRAMIEKMNPHFLESNRMGGVNVDFGNAMKSLRSLSSIALHGESKADAQSIFDRNIEPLRNSSVYNSKDASMHNYLNDWMAGLNMNSTNPEWLKKLGGFMYTAQLSAKPRFITQVLMHKIVSTGLPESIIEGKGIEGKIKSSIKTGILHPDTHTFMAAKLFPDGMGSNSKYHTNPNDEKVNYMNRLFNQGYIGDLMQRYVSNPDGDTKQSTIGKALDKLNGWSTLHVDMATRVSSALNAYDIAKSKGLSGDALMKYGRDYINKVNFVYNKTNMMPFNNPLLVGKAKPVANLATQFLNTRINYAHYFFDDFSNWKKTMAKVVPASLFAGTDAAGALGVGKLFTTAMTATAIALGNMSKPPDKKEKLIMSTNPLDPNFLHPMAQFDQHVQNAVESLMGKGPEADQLSAFISHGFMGKLGIDASDLTDIGQIAPSSILNPAQRLWGLYGPLASKAVGDVSDLSEGDFPEGGLLPMQGLAQIKKNLYYAAHGQKLSHGMENDMTHGEALGNIMGLNQLGMTRYRDAEDMRRTVVQDNKDTKDKVDDIMQKSKDAGNFEAIRNYWDNPTDENFDKAFPELLNTIRERDNSVKQTLPQMYQRSGMTTDDKINDIGKWRSLMVSVSHNDSMFVDKKEDYTIKKWIKEYAQSKITDKDKGNAAIADFVDYVAGSKKNPAPAEKSAANVVTQ